MTEEITYYTPTSPLGTDAVAVKLDETPPDRIYDLFRERGSSSFLFFGEKGYLEFALVKETSNPLLRYGRQLLTLLWQTFRSNSYIQSKKDVEVQEPLATTENKPDFFCEEKAKDQVLLEGDRVSVLYPDNPITERHFLFVTKEHRTNFNEMTREEFVEVLTLAEKVGKIYPQAEKFYLCKTGFDAGQTVPHFHLHLIVIMDTKESLLGRLKIFCNIFFNMIPLLHTRLRGDALAARVNQYRSELQHVST